MRSGRFRHVRWLHVDRFRVSGTGFREYFILVRVFENGVKRVSPYNSTSRAFRLPGVEDSPTCGEVPDRRGELPDTCGGHPQRYRELRHTCGVRPQWYRDLPDRRGGTSPEVWESSAPRWSGAGNRGCDFLCNACNREFNRPDGTEKMGGNAVYRA